MKENHVVELEEGRLIAWCPAPVGEDPSGHLWRWELDDREDGTTEVVHTYDWSGLQDPSREARARATTQAMLLASLDRLAALADA